VRRRACSGVPRESEAEKRELERLNADMLADVRQCAEVHRQVRRYIRKIARPGIKLIDMCETLEVSVRRLIGARGLEAGIAFPTGCSLDHVAAHWTPNGGDETVLQQDHVMKLGARRRGRLHKLVRQCITLTIAQCSFATLR
jgi:methionyl aminopeptidase